MKRFVKNLESALNRHGLFYGLAMILVSFLLLWVNKDNYSLVNTIPIGISWAGIILVLEYLTHRLFHYSYRWNTSHRRQIAKRVVLVAIVFTTILDVFGGIFPRLWVFKQWSLLEYLILAIPAFIAYSYSLLMLYRLVKFRLNRYISGGSLSKKGHHIYHLVINTQLVSGLLLGIFSIYYLFLFVERNYFEVMNFNGSISEVVEWWFPFAPMLSLFFIFEYISFRQGKETLTRDFVKGNILPYIAIIVASILGIILFEFYNAPFLIWEYSNWPISDVRILELPLLAFIWWHTQFLALLAMLRAAIPQKMLDLW